MTKNGDLIKITDHKMLFWDEDGGVSRDILGDSEYGLVVSTDKISSVGNPLIEFLWQGKVLYGVKTATFSWFEVIDASDG
jgi:hypothetical protein